MSVDVFVISFNSLSMPWNSQEFWMSRTPSTFSLHLVFTSRIITALTVGLVVYYIRLPVF